jgi:hypothetical protein
MRKKLTIALLLLSGFVSGQDIEWKSHTVYDLTVKLPGKVNRTDTTFTKSGFTADAVILNTEQEGYSFTVTVIEGMDKSNDSEEKLLKDVGEGFCKGAQPSGFRCLIKDTVFDNLPAKRGRLTNAQFESAVSVNSYMILLNDKLYNLTAAVMGGSEDDQLAMKKFLDGADFNNAAKKDRKNGAGYSRGYEIGKIVGGFVVLLGVILVLVQITKNKAKKKTNIS